MIYESQRATVKIRDVALDIWHVHTLSYTIGALRAFYKWVYDRGYERGLQKADEVK